MGLKTPSSYIIETFHLYIDVSNGGKGRKMFVDLLVFMCPDLVSPSPVR